MDLLFRGLLVTILIMVLIIVSVFIYFLFKKRRTQHFETTARLYIQQHTASWYNYLVLQKTFDKKLLWRNDIELRAIEEILFSYVRNFSDQGILNQVTVFADQYLTADYRKKLKSKRPSTRINTLYRIRMFKMTSLWPELQQVLTQPQSSEEYFIVLKTYAAQKEDAFFEELLKKQNEFSEYQFKKVFASMSKENQQIMMVYFSQLSRVGKYAYIDLLGKNQDIKTTTFLHQLLTHADSEIRIRSLKAIHEIGIILDKKLILSFTQSEIWQERLMVTRVMRHLPFQDTEEDFKGLIEDSNWWVRNEAARVLSFTKAGQQVLETILETSTDRFAVDVSRQYLLRGG